MTYLFSKTPYVLASIDNPVGEASTLLSPWSHD